MPVFSPRPIHVAIGSGDNGRLIQTNLGTAHYTSTDLDEIALTEAVGGYRRAAALQTNFFQSPQSVAGLDNYQVDNLSTVTGMVAGTTAIRAESDNSAGQFGLKQTSPSVVPPNTQMTLSFWLFNDDGRQVNAYIKADMESELTTYSGNLNGQTQVRPVVSWWTHHYVTFTTLDTEDSGEDVNIWPYFAARAPSGPAADGQAALLWGMMLNLGAEPLYFFDGTYRGTWTGATNLSSSTFNEAA